MANPGMVKWHLLCSRQVKPEELEAQYVVAVDTDFDGFDHTRLPEIQARVEAARNFAEALDAFTEIIEAATAFLLPLVREKRVLDKWT